VEVLKGISTRLEVSPERASARDCSLAWPRPRVCHEIADYHRSRKPPTPHRPLNSHMAAIAAITYLFHGLVVLEKAYGAGSDSYPPRYAIHEDSLDAEMLLMKSAGRKAANDRRSINSCPFRPCHSPAIVGEAKSGINRAEFRSRGEGRKGRRKRKYVDMRGLFDASAADYATTNGRIDTRGGLIV